MLLIIVISGANKRTIYHYKCTLGSNVFLHREINREGGCVTHRDIAASR